jgi:hypothetical protein
MALRLGTKNSTLRNRAFELFQELWVAIGATGPSADEFRNLNKPAAQLTRYMTKVGLQRFAAQNSITLENPWDPLADYDTAYANLEKVTPEASGTHAQALAGTYWDAPPASDMAALYASPPPPPVGASPVPGWLLLGSAGLLAWWFFR